MANNAVDPLLVGDQAFLVASMIERCPKTMMLRELLMNSIEAASKTLGGNGRIELQAREIDGISKLAIWNSGPGMTDQELYRICNIAASVGKEKGLDANFGMGAKVASLPSNRYGLRYWSCKDGTVSQVILGQRDGEYGRLRITLEDGTSSEVINVTETAKAQGYDTNEDWTEVVLFGNKKEQDTNRDPYDGNPKVPAQWIADTMYHRFYRLPPNIKIRLLPPTNKLNGPRYFSPIPDRQKFFERYESVKNSIGIIIHYYFDAPLHDSSHNRSVSGSIATDLSICGIVYKNELYDVKKGRQWTVNAPIFGIPFGAKHISIHIELPDDFAVRPEAYRQFLQYRDGEQRRADAEDFASLVRENRPQWLIDIIKSFAPADSASNDEIRDELQQLLNDLRVQSRGPKPSPDGDTPYVMGVGRGAQPVRDLGSGRNGGAPRSQPDDIAIAPAGAKKASITLNLERAPRLIELRNLEELEQKEIKGKAGKYYSETGELYLNMLYPSIDEMSRLLETEYAAAEDIEMVREQVKKLSERTLKYRVGRAVVFALAKQQNQEWSKEDMAKAYSPESLSLAADDFFDALQNARRRLGKMLRAAGNQATAPNNSLGSQD